NQLCNKTECQIGRNQRCNKLSKAAQGSRRLEGRGGEVAALRSRSRATRAGFEVDVVSKVGERARVEVRGVAVTGVRGRKVERQETGAGQEAGPQE
ncbi:hypothetical protein CRG98_049853, partial [Punica granatum]